MGESLSFLQQLQNNIYMVFLICLALLLFVALIRAVKGPQVADRLVAVNMMGTIVMVMLAILALRLKEDFLLDICLIYAMVSFLAVIVLSKVYIGIYEEKRHEQDGDPNAENSVQAAADTIQATENAEQAVENMQQATENAEQTAGNMQQEKKNAEQAVANTEPITDNSQKEEAQDGMV